MPARNPDGSYPPEVDERIQEGKQAATRNIEATRTENAVAFARVEKSIKDLRKPGQPRKARLFQLQQIGAQWSALFARRGACRAGCAHCCHLETLLYRSEAQVIAKAIGRELREPRRPRAPFSSEPVAKVGYDNPCIFLQQGRCAIYDHRPLVCRTTVNMDDDPQLCELLVRENVPAPFANWEPLRRMQDYLCEGETLADIRDWFRSED